MSKLRNWLYLLPVIILPVVTTSCVVSKNDLGQSKSAREWISVCAKDNQDIYCKAAEAEIKNYSGPIIFLHPNAGGDDTTRYLKERYPSNTSVNIVKIVRSNLFRGYELKSGEIMSWDERKRQVICVKATTNCTIEDLVGSKVMNRLTPEEYGGMVYIMTNMKKSWPHLLMP